MFSLKTKSSCLFFGFATILLLLKPSAANAQSIEPSDVSDAKSLGASLVKSDADNIAQFEREREIEVEEPIETNRSYLGIGGNIGLGGNDTQIGRGAFTVLGKGALSSHFAIHPALLFGDRNTILLPLTYGVSIKSGSSEVLYPFVGGGILVKEIFDDFDIGGLLTAGTDIPFTDKVVGTARVNVGFADDTDVGILLGVGYGI